MDPSNTWCHSSLRFESSYKGVPPALYYETSSRDIQRVLKVSVWFSFKSHPKDVPSKDSMGEFANHPLEDFYCQESPGGFWMYHLRLTGKEAALSEFQTLVLLLTVNPFPFGWSLRQKRRIPRQAQQSLHFQVEPWVDTEWLTRHCPLSCSMQKPWRGCFMFRKVVKTLMATQAADHLCQKQLDKRRPKGSKWPGPIWSKSEIRRGDVFL